MAAGVYDISIFNNEWLIIRLTYKDSNGTPVDLTGYRALLEVGVIGCADPLLTITPTLDAIGGIVATATLDQLTAAGIIAGTLFKHRLTIIKPNGEPKVILTGKLKVIC